MTVLFRSLRLAVAFTAINVVGRIKVNALVNRTMASKIPAFTLNTGQQIPCIGYGTWQAKDEELEKAVEAALEAGYRHIDTAYVYENEKVIGKVLKRWFDDGKLKNFTTLRTFEIKLLQLDSFCRRRHFLVTKLPPTGNRPEGVSKYLKKSLENLQMDYVDLYLIHVPFAFKEVGENLHPTKADGTIDMDITTDHVAIWKEMEKQMDAGLTRAIGVSNFNKTQMERILKNCRIQPSSLQIELHVYFQQNELVDLCKKHNILVTAYSPLGSPGLAEMFAKIGRKFDLPDILGNPTVKAIGEKYSKSAAQVVLRFYIQRGNITYSKKYKPWKIETKS
ncbi:hypothetical protein WA026_007810 [Henosepilachna vigintioctopunctata]|uniref:NADP-dependent oxidoreductase domain-containing protein n=1 Tax=Henosepilachna vigintioctopunctata TaxID=420089 RepID=A0AAW1U592_9CUCU